MKEIFDLLQGDWVLSRTISNFGRFEGTARFGLQGENILRYCEKGILISSAGQHFAAYKNYIYQLENDTLQVYFDETPLRLFHEIDFVPANNDGKWVGAAEHFCASDMYQTRYEIISPSAFRMIHEVKGPKKAFKIESEYLKG